VLLGELEEVSLGEGGIKIIGGRIAMCIQGNGRLDRFTVFVVREEPDA
jgi:hypothetical protein